MQNSPAQQSLSCWQVSNFCWQLEVDCWHRPPTQTWLQHSSGLVHSAPPPLHGGSQVPVAHSRGEQHGSLKLQALPAKPHELAVQRFWSQIPLQHSVPVPQDAPPVLQASLAHSPFEQIPLQHMALLVQVRLRSRQPWSYCWQVPSMQPSRREVQSSQAAPPRPQLCGPLVRQTPSAPQQPSGQVLSEHPVSPLQAATPSTRAEESRAAIASVGRKAFTGATLPLRSASRTPIPRGVTFTGTN